jgi:ABC-type phosphate transport system substrate-binding protein
VLRLIVLLVCLLAAGPSRPARASDLLIIANPAAGDVGQLSANGVAAIYLLRVTTWPDGTHIVPVNRELGSAIRTDFTTLILKEDMASLSVYWNEMHFKGKQPPLIQPSEAAMLAFVQKVPGAIGYIDAATAPVGVKVIGRFPNPSSRTPLP